jgi:hypothetical protein
MKFFKILQVLTSLLFIVSGDYARCGLMGFIVYVLFCLSVFPC